MATRPVPDTASDSGEPKPPAPGYKYIHFEITEFIARLTLSHAPHNVLTVPMMKEMAEAIESLNGRGDVKSILLQSSQQAFSAGISLEEDRKSTRLNSSHSSISYAVFCLKKKNTY